MNGAAISFPYYLVLKMPVSVAWCIGRILHNTSEINCGALIGHEAKDTGRQDPNGDLISLITLLMKYSGPPRMNAVGTVSGRERESGAEVDVGSELFAVTRRQRVVGEQRRKELNYFMANITVTDNVVFIRNELNGPQNKHKSGN